MVPFRVWFCRPSPRGEFLPKSEDPPDCLAPSGTRQEQRQRTGKNSKPDQPRAKTDFATTAAATPATAATVTAATALPSPQTTTPATALPSPQTTTPATTVRH